MHIIQVSELFTSSTTGTKSQHPFQERHQMIPQNGLPPTQPPTLRCGLANVRSLCNKASDVAEFILVNKVSVFFITETWLRDDDEFDSGVLNEASPVGFLSLSFPRKDNRRGGGLAVIHERSVSVHAFQHESSFSSFEVCFFKLQFSHKIIQCILIYRPPQHSLSTFLLEFEQLCVDCITSMEILILGDFNLPSSSPSYLAFVSLLQNFSLDQHIHFSTHCSGNTLDLLITRSTSSLLCSCCCRRTLGPLWCHLLNECACISKTNDTITFRRLNSICPSLLRADLQIQVTNKLLQLRALRFCHGVHPSDFVSKLTNSYNVSLRCVLDAHAPLITKRVTNRPLVPWWSSAIANSRRTLRRAEKRWISTKQTSDYEAYLDAKRRHRRRVTSARRQHIRVSLSKYHLSSRSTWKQLHRMLGRHPPPVLPDAPDAHGLAIKFNHFFLNKPRDLNRTLAEKYPTDFLSRPTLPIVPAATHRLYSLPLTNEAEVRGLILTSPIKSSPDDPLPTPLLRRYLSYLLPAITALVNVVLTEGMPEDWKIATVLPLLKRPKLDYRPVSLLPFRSKVAERHVHRRLYFFLVDHSVLDSQQAAYRHNHSCESALTYVTDRALRAMDNGEVTLLVLLDMSAAFDCVSHTILLDILACTGVDGDALRWFRHYLSGRKQCTSIRGTRSPLLPVTSGVPQGSVLGPLLFTLYMLGIKDVLQPFNVSYVIYADDIQLFVSASPSSLQHAITRLETCIANLLSWLVARHLTLNAAKTELILFGTKRTLANISFPVLNVGGARIAASSSVRDLGVLLDSNLTMEAHVMSIRAAVFGRLRNISRIRIFLTPPQCSMVVKSLVISHFSYCATLMVGIESRLIDKLQTALNATIRLLYRLRHCDCVNDVLKEEGLLPVKPYVKP